MPPIIYKVFIIHTYKFKFVELFNHSSLYTYYTEYPPNRETELFRTFRFYLTSYKHVKRLPRKTSRALILLDCRHYQLKLFNDSSNSTRTYCTATFTFFGFCLRRDLNDFSLGVLWDLRCFVHSICSFTNLCCQNVASVRSSHISKFFSHNFTSDQPLLQTLFLNQRNGMAHTLHKQMVY